MELFQEPDGEEVLYLILNESEIQINWLNNIENDLAIAYVPIHTIKSIKITHLKYPNRVSLVPRRDLEKYIQSVKRKCPGFNEEVKLKYNDKYALTVVHNKEGFTSYIPIPSTWFEDGNYQRLIESIQQLSSIKVDDSLLKDDFLLKKK